MSTPLINPIPGCLSPSTATATLGPFAYGGALYVPGFSQWNGDAGNNQDGQPSVVSMFRSADNGNTWSIVDLAGSPQLLSLDSVGGSISYPDARTFWCLRHSTLPELWLVYVDTAGNLRVSAFDLASNSWSATSPVGPAVPYPANESAYQSSANGPQAAFSLTTGDLVVLMWDYAPAPAGLTARPHTVKLQGGISGAWTVPQLWPGMPSLVNWADKWYCSSICQGSSGRVHGFMQFFDGNYNAYHYLMEDGSGGSGVAVEAMTGLQIQDFVSNCLVSGNVVLYGSDGFGSVLITAVSANSPVWSTAPLPAVYGSPLTVALFPDTEGSTDVARIAAPSLAGLYVGYYDLLSYSTPDLLTANVYVVASGLKVGSYALAVSSGGAGTIVSSITFSSPSSTVDAPLDTGRKPPLLKPPNYYDCCLDTFRRHVEARLDSLVSRPDVRCKLVEMPGGYMMPVEGREWYERVSIITPAINPPPGQLVLDFECPVGYNGILYGVTNQYLGTGFVQGSGDLIWRVQIGNAWVRDMGEMLYMLGGVGQPFPLADQEWITSGQRIRMFVQTVNASGMIQVGVARMVMELQGWWFPV